MKFTDSRALSALELLLGTGIVIGHNVFRVLPNEVPILAVLGLISFRVRSGGWAALPFRRPKSWWRIVAVAVAAAALRIVLGGFVETLASKVWPPIVAPAGSEAMAGDLKTALLWLGLVWTWAAFGEEFGYRGYLLTRAADIGKGSAAAYLAGMVFVAVLFGFGHFYKGPAGIVDSGVAGLMFGAAYLISGRNLWASVLAHGFVDTYGVTALYFGWAT
ncbi:MAG: CPBP family intramembrane metalloprotease [Acidobacteria bacterium]|nr:CPBP family intramembrane metalloprotease [Acidobacteriota bacterium]